MGRSLTGQLYVALDRKFISGKATPGQKLSYEWKSKKFVTSPPINYGAAKIDADFDMTEVGTCGRAGGLCRAIAANQALIVSDTMNDGLADPSLGEYEIGGDGMQDIPPLAYRFAAIPVLVGRNIEVYQAG